MADAHGCGWFRVGWPAQRLIEQGFDIELVQPDARSLFLSMGRDGMPVDVRMPADAEVVVLQRVTNKFMAAAIPLMRAKGIAVVVDIDDDLAAINPNNPAFHALHPRNEGLPGANGQISHHSWAHLTTACRNATMVTVSAPALLHRYAPHGNGRVVPNMLPDFYYGRERIDTDRVVWPAALMSHPDDPSAVGNAVARLVNLDGADFDVVSTPAGTGRAFGLSEDPPGIQAGVSVTEWPDAILGVRPGIGIVPLADTLFNKSKSWLKGLELSALGVPWVGSESAPEYRRLHALGAGVLAANAKQWYRQLRDLRASQAAREDLAGRGLAVAAGLRMRDGAWRYHEVWEEALKLQRS